MIRHELLEDRGVLILSPEGPLQEADFDALGKEIDGYLERGGTLRGMMIRVESFPGWDSFGALVSHLRFVRDHHRELGRVAAVTDDRFLAIMPRVVDHFVGAEVRHFDYAESERAMAWLAGTEEGEPRMSTDSGPKTRVPAGEVVRTAELVNYQADAVVSRTLAKKSKGTVTVFAFDAGQGLSEHTAPFDALVQVLDGEAEVTLSGTVHRVPAGSMVVMPANEPHALHAASRFKMLLTMIRE